MTKLTLNNTEFTINGYSRYTDLNNGQINSYANVSFPDNSQYNALANIGTITSLSIAIDGTSVYSLSSISARVTNINESLSEGGMVMSATIRFDAPVVE